ncbi:tripartite tricarboxylate transporter substrate binding protein [Bordetella sp. BOR01]|uniref:Bug family tripartite tricarboxylate transporter substrate binding protein n=1 Tax=Bordetella sp. BOR01 TaxID=2854779 RepID=UPI002101F1A2|nr:tripartite tricarboxylate transporter substrate-binding protein [Bordetella sp. BOR01]
MISRRTALRALVATSVTPAGFAVLGAEKFPSRPVRIVVPYAVGTATDSTARLLADGLAKVWGVPVAVENIAAASGIVGSSAVAKLPGDGYTIIMVAANHVINPHLYRDLPFDPIRDFTPICMVAQTQVVVVVNASSDLRDLKGLIAESSRNPGRLNYGSAGNGSVGHLVMEQIKQASKVSITHIPYRGQNQALTDLAGGQVDVALPALAAAEPFLRSGRLRAIAVTGSQRSPLFPDIPTIEEQIGRPVEGLAWWGLLGPRGMPADIVEIIGSAVREQLRAPAMLDQMRTLSAEVVASSAQEMEQMMRTDLARVGQVVAAAHLKID